MMYFIAYIFVGIICLLISTFIKREKRFFDYIGIILICIIYAVYSASLPFGESDRSYYALHFDYTYATRLGTLKNIFSQSEVEYGFALFNLALRQITENPRVFFFISSFLPNFLALYSMYQIRKPFFNKMFLFVFSWYPFLTIYSCRQMLAAGFLCIAYLHWTKQNRKRALIWNIVAISFHATSAIGIIYMALSLVARNKRMILSVLCGGLIASVSVGTIVKWAAQNIPIFEGKFLGSIGSENESLLVFLKGAPYLVSVVVVLFALNYMGKIDHSIFFWEIIAVGSWLSWMAAINYYWIYRMSFYGIIPLILLQEDIYIASRKKKMSEAIFWGLFLIGIAICLREEFLFFRDVLG